ncbi:MAG: DHA2 family efflux MFS transporter permease subunit [Chloroflexi bacterium]|nr:MAG: DHA2 family efflux MFS transporter permease subunit [Chloroflexota bacterium]
MSVSTSSRIAAEAAAQELSWLKRWVVLGIVCVGVFMNTLDTGITDVLNPVFTAQFHLNLYVEYWIELSYAIPLIGMLLPAGHLGDRFGRKNVFLAGMILFGGGSGLLTLMPTFESMFVARVIEGVGAACISANGGVLAVSVFPWNQRGQVLGIIGTAVALGLKFGPVMGGLLYDNFGWRSAFLINVAIGITFVIIGANVVPASRRSPGRTFDVWGALLFVIAMGCLLVIINQAPTWGWSSPQTLILSGGVVVFGSAFFWVSRHVKDPTIDLSLYKSRNFTVAVAAAFISFLALTPINHLLPFYMEHVQGLHVSETGLVFITTTIAIAVTQPFSGRWADRIGSRPVASLGLLLEGLGLLTLAFIPLHMNPDWLVPELVVIGVGVGLFRSPNHRALFGAVPRDKMGQAGGYQHLPRQLGESIGETGVVTMFTAIVLASAALAGIHAVDPASQAVAAAPQPAPVPTAQAPPAGVARPPVVVGAYVPAAQAGQPVARGAGLPIISAAPGTTIDANTADDTIVDVPDDSAGDAKDSGLSQAVTSLPADVQMLGYRLMWGLAGLISLGGAAISWFGRESEEEVAASTPRRMAVRPAPQTG